MVNSVLGQDQKCFAFHDSIVPRFLLRMCMLVASSPLRRNNHK